VDTSRDRDSTTSPTPQPESADRRVDFKDSDSFNHVVKAIAAGNSVIVLGEAGTGKTDFALALHQQMSGEFNSAIATYKGSIKKFFIAIAMQLDIPTAETQYNKNGDPTGEKDLTVDALKQEILENAGEDTLLIFPESKRLTTSIRYWIEDMMSAGAKVVCFAVANPGKDIFIDMLEIELSLPSDAHIRLVMAAEAQRQGLQIDKSRLAELQPLAGRNPMLARKIIKQEKLGIKQDKPEHTNYVVIMPVIIAMLFSFAVVRFIGMGTGNKGLYITGGVCLVSAMALKQLGNVRGARKRLGQ
jgi:energy-coupling factor transporter ATP-binding protein EcfA2